MSGTVQIKTQGFGTMSMTWTPNPQPFEKSIETLKYVKDKFGVKFFNTAQFYQFDPNFSNLQLIADFLKEEKDEDIVISIKGCVDPAHFQPDGSKEFVDKSIKESLEYFKDLPVKPKILFGIARVDKRVPYEETVGYIYEHVKNGDIDGVFLSEVSAESIKKAAAVAQISAIEVEWSLFTQDIIHNGILAEASKHGIPIVAYSPLCRAMLTDYAVENPDFLDNIDPKDIRKILSMERFTPEVFEQNKACLKELYDFAYSKNLNLETLAISYLESASGIKDFYGIPQVSQIIPIPSGSTKDKNDKNFATVKLTRDEIDKIQAILEKNPVIGVRYNKHLEETLNG